MTVNELIQKSEDYLKDSNNANYLADIKILIAFFMKTSLAKLYAIQNDKINFKIDDYWQQLIAYRNGKPIQHITNLQNFYGYDFYVDYNVLIPRYETEELVDNINIIIDEMFLNNCNKRNCNKRLTLIDIGTGSGAIAISLGLENPNLTIYASDISIEALKVAKRNIKQLNCKNVKLLEGDMLEPFIKNKIKADLLVCNPPYIPNNQKISHHVKNYEPHVALFGDADGLYFYREIFQNWQKVVKKNGILCFEHGYDQKKDLEKLVKEYFPNQKYYFQKDINKKWRMLFINIL
ncbi:peptide chain release factor N(5)-glutamine methyltransferase [Spiroplasma citri]|uniref:Peptide chain release factor N(5)-glutamine methyltransferase n=1 Tax=Spiroplasma citri TaxID=2133 RepID=A0AAJ4EHX3_SPICI|nr:peptide chain release factor N(5)-glutamine methyltransferase [Spiroplasma citri]APE73980.1 putative S-adenosyl-methionine-dependent methyltransferase [Spiroplasma citri]QIA66266.1 peptide chain release factor N(5)-glutamine methyltransferase [Spiroplasma citri]QIA68118.1 peptide chain release factor N(5)-glutamine methyltransferase [Spiroplasma citri]QIA69995.1 peptide chain release factor N(5)-glutamine methyltransferase [Spiroplasma citri]QIA72227.1 peptide chain release factor N(5)-glut